MTTPICFGEKVRKTPRGRAATVFMSLVLAFSFILTTATAADADTRVLACGGRCPGFCPCPPDHVGPPPPPCGEAN